MIKKDSISKFLNEVSFKTPTPGGGAVAAVSAAMSIALCQMVFNLTKDINLKAGNLEKLRERLLELADEDVAAFDGVIAAYKSKDQGLIQKNLKTATEVPLETAKISSELEKIARILVKKGNKNAVSDAKTAFYLAHAAKLSALENVYINLKYIKDENYKQKILKIVKGI